MGWIELAVSVICAVLASSGMWTFMQKRADKKDARTQMIVGLGHDRITFLGIHYVERGYSKRDEYEHLYE